MRHLCLPVIALVGLTSAATAGDLPSAKATPIFVPPPSAYSWTGVYVGANVGLGAGNEKEFTYIVSGNGYMNYDSSGVLGGVQVGGNYQINNLVLGAEADFDLSGIQAHEAFHLPDLFHYGAMGGEIDSLGSVRGRLGYAFLDNRALIYATGGFAFGQVKGVDNGTLLGAAYNHDQSIWATGWTVGAGLEYALTDNWTIRGEYQFVQLGRVNWSAETTAAGPGVVLSTVPVRYDTNLLRFGLNYKFGAPAAIGAVSGVAPAADLPSTKEGRVAPPAFTWTGVYVGANVGFGAGSEKVTALPIGDYDRYNSGGPLGGAQIGGNYQITNFVLGAEADFDFAGVQGSATIHDNGTGGHQVYGGAVNALGSLRGRLGYALLDNRALIYATGGFAFGQVKGVSHGKLLASYDYGQTIAATGWTAGAGLEYALTDHWTVRGEYLYADLGRNNWPNQLASAIPGVTMYTVESSVNVLRLGLNYKFVGPMPGY